MDFYSTALYFFIYSFFGWCTEVAFAAFKEHRFVNRGFLNGPFCPIYGFGVTIVITFLTPYRSNLILLYIASVVLVTLLEGLTGWAMDKIFHNKWWDYSEMPLNIGGYVCLLFSLIWGVACVAIMNLVHPLIQDAVGFIPHILGIILIIVLGLLLITDACVTASAIFKFNRQLEHMEKIAAELHELSDQIGENIYERTIKAMDIAEDIQDKAQDAVEEFHEKRQDVIEEFHEKRQDVSEDIQEHLAELKQRYQEFTSKTDRNTKRLLRAFPKLESRQHKERLSEIREEVRKRLKK